jgi:hypothetical protein
LYRNIDQISQNAEGHHNDSSEQKKTILILHPKHAKNRGAQGSNLQPLVHPIKEQHFTLLYAENQRATIAPTPLKTSGAARRIEYVLQ